MNLAALRTALAEAMPTTPWHVYDHSTGSPELPALVIGLPKAITPGASMKLYEVELPIVVIASMADEGDAQATLSAAFTAGASSSVLDALKGATSTQWRSINVTGIDNFGTITVGNATSAMTATINLSILVNA